MRGCHAAASADDEHNNGDDDVECGTYEYGEIIIKTCKCNSIQFESSRGRDRGIIRI